MYPLESVVALLFTHESPAFISMAAAAQHAWDLTIFLAFTPRQSVQAATNALATAQSTPAQWPGR